MKIQKAESVIITVEDDVTCIKVTRFIHDHFPEVQVVAKTDTVSNTDRFLKLGASMVVSKNLEAGLQLAKAGLRSVGAEDEETDNILKDFRDINSDFVRSLIKNS